MDAIEQITLYGFGATRQPRRVECSPFVMKLHLFLRLAKVPHKLNTSGKLSPKAGRCPWVEIKYKNGKTKAVEDSQRIVDELTKECKISLDDHLSEEQKIQGEALRLLTENVAYHCVVRSVWVDHPEYVEAQYPIPLPWPIVGFVVGRVRKDLIDTLDRHGNGDLDDNEYAEVWLKTLKAINLQLGNKKFLFSDSQPSSFDCATAFYAHEVPQVMPCVVLEYLKAHPKLAAWGKRVYEEAFPDNLDEVIDNSLKFFDTQKASITKYVSIGAAVATVIVAVGGFYLVKYFRS